MAALRALKITGDLRLTVTAPQHRECVCGEPLRAGEGEKTKGNRKLPLLPHLRLHVLMFQLDIDFLAAFFVPLALPRVRPSKCLIKVQLTLPVKGRGAISLPICSAKALADMFFCSYSSCCHPGSHQCTDPNIPALSEPPLLILGQTGPQHKQARPAPKPGMDSDLL